MVAKLLALLAQINVGVNVDLRELHSQPSIHLSLSKQCDVWTSLLFFVTANSEVQGVGVFVGQNKQYKDTTPTWFSLTYWHFKT